VLHTLLRLDTTGPLWPPALGCRLMRRCVRICALLGASYTTLPGAVFKDKDEDGDAALAVLRCMRHCAPAAASGVVPTNACAWQPTGWSRDRGRRRARGTGTRRRRGRPLGRAYPGCAPPFSGPVADAGKNWWVGTHKKVTAHVQQEFAISII
jgi:hypothetical protein